MHLGPVLTNQDIFETTYLFTRIGENGALYWGYGNRGPLDKVDHGPQENNNTFCESWLLANQQLVKKKN